ncbi:hypothetical protein NUW54_g10372 [Trametes sanguinea]|uniref:Uncharacterized protein n=1 Tax=Trametes sanguinea TaxID=158606 RepID=A0ACC1NZJ8_9APHY|nr:hypothetical protein NUW54_g10372 [Trametes sanguinea]
MVSPLSLAPAPSGHHGSLSLRKAAFYVLVFSYLGSGIPGVSADGSVIEELLHDMEQALGISTSSDAVAPSTSIASSTQDASLSATGSSSASLSVSPSSSESTSSSALPSGTNLDQAATSVSLTATTAVLPTPSSAPQNSSASSGNLTQTPAVFAHVIVGNTYNYTAANWLQGLSAATFGTLLNACILCLQPADITLAASKGIDAFALNVGSDNWEPSQVANAYAAAGQYNRVRPKPDLVTTNGTDITNSTNGTNSTAPSPFKLFLSFDMGSLPCSQPTDVQLLQTYIKTYANNTNQMTYNGRMLVSTFAGESCTFGASSLNQAWVNAVKPTNSSLPSVWFVPSFFIDPSTFPGLPVIDGAFHWNSAWPMGNYNVTFAPDLSYINNLGNRTYMASVAPWFFTVRPPLNTALPLQQRP